MRSYEWTAEKVPTCSPAPGIRGNGNWIERTRCGICATRQGRADVQRSRIEVLVVWFYFYESKINWKSKKQDKEAEWVFLSIASIRQDKQVILHWSPWHLFQRAKYRLLADVIFLGFPMGGLRLQYLGKKTVDQGGLGLISTDFYRSEECASFSGLWKSTSLIKRIKFWFEVSSPWKTCRHAEAQLSSGFPIDQRPFIPKRVSLWQVDSSQFYTEDVGNGSKPENAKHFCLFFPTLLWSVCIQNQVL